MWLEIKDKEIIGIHTDKPSQSDYKLVEVPDASFLDLKKWYTEEKGIHEPILSDAQILENKNISSYNEALRYLKDTDYVITKINESIILNDDALKEELMTKYKDIISKRNECRIILRQLGQ